MIRRITLPDEQDLFQQLFATVRRSWFRLETLQRYDDEYERQEFADFLRGEPVDLTPGPWQEMIRGHRAAGRTLARVHVIEEPHSDYIRYELAGYPVNVEAGEDVRVIPVRAGEWPHGVPRHDFWLFDDDYLWLMDYDSKGTLRDVVREPDRGIVAQHRQWREAALAQSIPLRRYLSNSLRDVS